MKTYLLLVFSSLLFSSCSSDDNTTDYSSFLNETTPQFNAKIDGIEKSWKFDSNFQLGMWGDPMTEDPADSNRYLSFMITEQSLNRRFVMRTPAYNASSLTEFQQTFGIGKKELGSYIKNFYITVKDGNHEYLVCAATLGNKLEILKTVELIDPIFNLPCLKVWFKINKINSTNCSTGDEFEMKDVMIIAEFVEYKNF
jgi:hypothetical protein